GEVLHSPVWTTPLMAFADRSVIRLHSSASHLRVYSNLCSYLCRSGLQSSATVPDDGVGGSGLTMACRPPDVDAQRDHKGGRPPRGRYTDSVDRRSLEAFEDEARVFLEANAKPLPPKTIEWGVGSDVVGNRDDLTG